MERGQYLEIYNIERNHWWFRGRRKIIESCLKSFLPNKVANALDVGCGTGFNMILLENFAEKVSGLDKSEVAIRLAKKLNPKLNLIKGSFPEFVTGQQYDIITLLDVLEHIEDDSTALKRIEELLLPGGIALITVPAFSFLWTNYDRLLHHKRRYTKKMLKKLIVSRTSLLIKKMSYFNTLMFLPILIFRALRKVFNLNKDSSDLFILPRPLNSLFEKIFSLESFILRWANFPFGVSILLVLRKSL